MKAVVIEEVQEVELKTETVTLEAIATGAVARTRSADEMGATVSIGARLCSLPGMRLIWARGLATLDWVQPQSSGRRHDGSGGGALF